MDNEPGALFATGTNIASRADSVQVNNQGATLEWFTETINSRNRDQTLWKFPSRYVVPLSRTHKRVLEIELLTAEFPRSVYTIESCDQRLGNTGNDSLRFGEGYIIDNGEFYGIHNDRLCVREYQRGIPQNGTICSVSFPRTLSKVAGVSIIQKKCNQPVLKVTMDCCTPHNLSIKHTPEIWIIDGDLIDGTCINGKYTLVEVIDTCTFIASPSKCDGPTLCAPECIENSPPSPSSPSLPGITLPYLYVPRISSPCALASMVQDYLNARAEPPVENAYSVTFNKATGRFVFDCGYGVLYFDVLAQSDSCSIFPTMGFGAVDYFYGSWSSQNVQQTILPSNQFFNIIRPTIVSETVGDSALVCIPQGNYLPSTLANALTQEMQRPIIQCCQNDTLVVQLLGQVITLTIPQGMYTPDNLAESIAYFLTQQYHILCGETCETFLGKYDLENGVYIFESTKGAVFGLLFSQSTIATLLGFLEIDLTGSCYYTSMRSVFVPFANKRYTSSVYSVVPQLDQFKFRFLKTGQFQAPIVKLTTRGEHILIHTWTAKKKGAAHGFQVGDLVRIEGSCQEGIKTSTGFVGVHVVEKVVNAYIFEIRGRLNEYTDPQGKENTTKEDGEPKITKRKMAYVASHWFEPFYLFFPGVVNTISQVVGFPESQSGCLDYLGTSQWDFLRRIELFLNITNVTDGQYGRVWKTHNSGPQNKYTYDTLNSFIRIPYTLENDFGILAAASFSRRKRFLFNTVDFSELSIAIVDSEGELVQFNGRDHSFDIRFLTEQ